MTRIAGRSCFFACRRGTSRQPRMGRRHGVVHARSGQQPVAGRTPNIVRPAMASTSKEPAGRPSRHAFNAQWNGQDSPGALLLRPLPDAAGPAGSLKGQDYVNVVAYILARAGAGRHQKLTVRSPMDRVLVLSDTQTAAAVDGAVDRAVTLGALIGSVVQPSTRTPTQAELDAADDANDRLADVQQGLSRRTLLGSRTLNTATAAKLRAVCMFQLGELGTFSTGPVVYDGLLYATTHLGTYAIDATTCARVDAPPRRSRARR